MSVEHIEMQIDNHVAAIFKKYLKVLKIEASYDNNPAISLLSKHSYFDLSKK